MPLFPGIITKNWQLKLAALAMAVLLWTVPRFDSQSRQTLADIPVRVQLNDPQFALAGDPFPATVQVTLSGPARALFGLEVDRPSVMVPIDRVVSTDTAVVLRYQWLRLPEDEGVVVEELRPSNVRLSFEAIEIRALGLGLRTTGSLPEGLSFLAPPTLTPQLVRISGPASRLGAMDSLYLIPVDLSQVRGSMQLVQAVDTAGLMGMIVAPMEAAVRFTVEETLERTVAGVPVRLPTLPQNPQLQARPASVSVTLVGARSLVEAVDSAALTVIPREGARTLTPGEEARVELVVEGEGIPNLVTARVEPRSAILRRPAGQ